MYAEGICKMSNGEFIGLVRDLGEFPSIVLDFLRHSMWIFNPLSPLKNQRLLSFLSHLPLLLKVHRKTREFPLARIKNPQNYRPIKHSKIFNFPNLQSVIQVQFHRYWKIFSHIKLFGFLVFSQLIKTVARQLNSPNNIKKRPKIFN